MERMLPIAPMERELTIAPVEEDIMLNHFSQSQLPLELKFQSLLVLLLLKNHQLQFHKQQMDNKCSQENQQNQSKAQNQIENF
jgi:hypothetical protein